MDKFHLLEHWFYPPSTTRSSIWLLLRPVSFDNGAYYRSQEDFFLSLVRSVRERAFFGGDGEDRYDAALLLLLEYEW